MIEDSLTPICYSPSPWGLTQWSGRAAHLFPQAAPQDHGITPLHLPAGFLPNGFLQSGYHLHLGKQGLDRLLGSTEGVSEGSAHKRAPQGQEQAAARPSGGSQGNLSLIMHSKLYAWGPCSPKSSVKAGTSVASRIPTSRQKAFVYLRLVFMTLSLGLEGNWLTAPD